MLGCGCNGQALPGEWLPYKRKDENIISESQVQQNNLALQEEEFYKEGVQLLASMYDNNEPDHDGPKSVAEYLL